MRQRLWHQRQALRQALLGLRARRHPQLEEVVDRLQQRGRPQEEYRHEQQLQREQEQAGVRQHEEPQLLPRGAGGAAAAAAGGVVRPKRGVGSCSPHSGCTYLRTRQQLHLSLCESFINSCCCASVCGCSV